MEIIISSIDRRLYQQDNLVDIFFESFYSKTNSSNQNIKIIVGSPETRYLNKYKSNQNLKILPVNRIDWNKVKKYDVVNRALFNYYRCLKESNKDTIVLEDDIIFTENWLIKLESIIKKLNQKKISKYIISLYTPFYESLKFQNDYGVLKTEWFAGTQGMFYPKSIKNQLTNWLYYNGIKEKKAPYDILIRLFCLANNIPIYYSKYSLVQHIGFQKSTGLGGNSISPVFKEKD